MRNKIHISHGMPRSGSTYLYQLISSLFFQLNSIENSSFFMPADFLSEAGISYSGDGYIHDSSDLEIAVDTLIDYDFGFCACVVIKTHCPISEKLSLLIDSEVISVSSTFRDSIDMAISVFNIACYEATRDILRFDRYDSIDSVISGVKHNIDSSLPWILNDKVLAVYFDFLTNDPHSVLLTVAKKMGLNADIHSIVDWFESNKSNRVGELSNFKSSIDREDLSRFNDFFNDYYDKLPALINLSAASLNKD